MSYGALICFLCGDYVYDRELELIVKRDKRKAARLLGWLILDIIHKKYMRCLLLRVIFHVFLGMKNIYSGWEPSNLELDLLKKNPRRKCITENSYIGKCPNCRYI